MTHDEEQRARAAADSLDMNQPATREEAMAIAAGITETWAQAVRAEVAALRERLDEAESKSMRYCGVWAASTTYAPGSTVTCAGSLWHTAIATVGQRPGQGTAWRLVAKRGADGRDGKDGGR